MSPLKFTAPARRGILPATPSSLRATLPTRWIHRLRPARWSLLVLWLALGWPAGLQAAELSLKVEDLAPPSELSAEIRGLLGGKAVRLMNGEKAAVEFWFRSELPLATVPVDPTKGLDAVKQPALLGAARVTVAARDYRDDEIPAGVYTVRYGIQPSDGNHLGTSEFGYFAVLIPAKFDLKLDGIADYKAMTKASSKDTSTDHPLIVSLRPVSGAVGAVPSLQTLATDHKSVRVRVPGRAGDAKVDIVFELVYEGHGHK